MKCAFLILIAAAVSSTALPQTPAPPLPRDFVPAPGKLEVKEGDTFVFVGDSITHQCLYTQYIEDYYFTRFPKVRVHFHNAGSAGDVAADALARLEEDVAPYKPQYVSVLLGMNDGKFGDKDAATMETYQKDMGALLDGIEKLGATPVLLTPTTYDALPGKLNGRGLEPRDTAYNNVLQTYATWVKELAKTRKLGVADFYSPLNGATTEQRRSKADWSIIPDGMHPQPEGHALMAAAFVNDVAFKPPISDILLLKKDGKLVGNGANGVIADLEEGEKISFTFTAQSLPWVLPAEAGDWRKLLKPGLKLNTERLTVRNIPAGTYELKIDGVAVGQWSDKDLSTGVELGENEKTPQHQQALRVAQLNLRRTALSEYPRRVWWAQWKGQQAVLKKAEELKETPVQIAAKKKSYDTWHENMLKMTGEFTATATAMEEELYQLAQPVPRRYELSPVSPPAGGS